jgi:hypothetical protein
VFFLCRRAARASESFLRSVRAFGGRIGEDMMVGKEKRVEKAQPLSSIFSYLVIGPRSRLLGSPYQDYLRTVLSTRSIACRFTFYTRTRAPENTDRPQIGIICSEMPAYQRLSISFSYTFDQIQQSRVDRSWNQYLGVKIKVGRSFQDNSFLMIFRLTPSAKF